MTTQTKLPFEISEFDFAVKASPKAKARNSSLKYDCIIGVRNAGEKRKFNIFDMQLTRFFATIGKQFKTVSVGVAPAKLELSRRRKDVIFAFDSDKIADKAEINAYQSKRGNKKSSYVVANKGMVSKAAEALLSGRGLLMPIAPGAELRIFCNLAEISSNIFKVSIVQVTLKENGQLLTRNYDEKGDLIGKNISPVLN